MTIILNDEKLNASPLKSGTRQGCHILSLPFNIMLEVLTRVVRKKFKKEERKRNTDRKVRELHLFIDKITAYVENIKEFIKKRLELLLVSLTTSRDIRLY